MQSTTLQRGAEERRVTLYKNGEAFLITVTVLQSLFHEVGHTETLYSPNTEAQAEYLYGSAVRFLQGFQYIVTDGVLA
jgi:hypothetical protein